MGMAVLILILLFVLYQRGSPQSPEENKRFIEECLPIYCANTEMNTTSITNTKLPKNCEPIKEHNCIEGSDDIYFPGVGGGFYSSQIISHLPLGLNFGWDPNWNLCKGSRNMSAADIFKFVPPDVCNCTVNGTNYYSFSNVSATQRCQHIHNENYEISFGLLTAAIFSQEHNMLNGECRSGGDFLGECISSSKDGKHKNRKVVIVLAVLASVILCLLSVIFIWYRHRRNSALANTSSDLSKSERQLSNIYFGVHIFSHTELEEATHNFDSGNALGDGGFGTVHYGKLRDGREVAVKRLYEHNCRRLEQFMNEIEILTRLHHKNLVELYGCSSRRSRQLLLVYEYIPNGTVADHLHGDEAKSASLTWFTRMRIAIETASALAYLHASEIIHRDVKTNNILLDNHFRVKVADFGISRFFPTDVTHVSTVAQGTPGYIDPEYHQCYQLTDKSDVYSFGVVLIELISGMPAVDLNRHRHQINLANLAISKIQNCEFDDLIDSSLGHRTDKEVERKIALVSKLAFCCLQQYRELRPCMREVLEELKTIEGGEYEWEVDVKLLREYSESDPPQ
ncbi:hypothetical protein K2173_000232 [Erythroxylum novogranatense]|uniref:Protein kinase domain-containing protein n=1 Tax=Erythroxylum novogranatense TaxID=1862640 RepID=A0AAV8SVQ5_9ROSI|nr:hypothetical protein K2173_000232 [Erythroxylum novogranatense]